MPIYGQAASLDALRRTFAYVFEERAPKGGGVPDIITFPTAGPFCLGRQEIVPIPLPHGPWTVFGFRIGAFAYLTDCNRVPDEALSRLEGVEWLVLDALRHRPHPTHFTVQEAIVASSPDWRAAHLAHAYLPRPRSRRHRGGLAGGRRARTRWTRAGDSCRDRGSRGLMQVVRYPDQPKPKWLNPVAALGNFDGLHRGHLKVLERVRRQAAERGGTPIAIVFDPHPPRVVRPDKAPKLLMTLDQKIDAFSRAGLQGVVIIHFTPELAQWAPEQFVETVLIDWLQVSEIWVGANFLFGRDRSGTFTLLRALGEDRGFRVDKIDPVRYKDFVVSSTRIRRLVGGRPCGRGRRAPRSSLHRRRHGDPRRRAGAHARHADGEPQTANELMPASGVYATVATVDGIHYPAVTSVGCRPTIGDGRFTIETHLLDPSICTIGG